MDRKLGAFQMPRGVLQDRMVPGKMGKGPRSAEVLINIL